MKKINIKNRKLLGLGLCYFFICTFLAAMESNNQQEIWRTTLRGSIIDNQGSLLHGVNVELMNIRTGKKMSTISSESGDFQFWGVDPGEYWVTVEMQGFSTQKSRVSVAVGQAQVLNFVLPLGDPVFGTLEGVIKLNPKNAAGIPKITILAENGEVVEEQEGSVTGKGNFAYSFDSLSPGIYMINVTMDGFLMQTKTIHLGERQVKKQNFTLKQKKK